MSIEHHADVRAYFRERLLAALGHHALRPKESTEFYLVNLLADYAVRPDDAMFGKTLFDMYAEASEATGAERGRKFRDLGDNALYVSGFFADHLAARGVSRSYAITMGERGYSVAGSLMQRWGSSSEPGFSDVYVELADHFEKYVLVLGDVREETALRTPQDIVRVYEKWRQTKSPVLAAQLERAGLFPQVMAEKGLVH